MSTAKKLDYTSPEEYLKAEEISATRNEYVKGLVRAMAGATIRHNTITVNVLVALGRQLHGQACRPFNSDTKVRVRNSEGTFFYYPDAFIVCDSNRDSETFQDKPIAIVEVLSPSTRALDLDEKLTAYLSIESLLIYILLEQDRPLAVVLRRDSGGFLREVHEGLGSTIQIPVLGCGLSLKDVYAGVDFTSSTIRESAPSYEP